MLKFKNIIDRMTEAQKLAFATDFKSLSEPWVVDLGIPMVKQASLEELNSTLNGGIVYPSIKSLANSWDTDLFSEISLALTKRGLAAGYNFITAPLANLNSGKGSRGLSEDPFLVGSYAGSGLSGIKSAGASSCLSEFALDEKDVSVMDNEPNVRAIREYYVRPFSIAVDRSECTAISTSTKPLNGSYSAINSELLNRILTKEFTLNKFVVSDDNSPQAIVSRPANNVIIGTNGNYSAFESAYGNFKRMEGGLQSGAVSAEELNTAVANGTSLDTETLDNIVDKVIDFAFSCVPTNTSDFTPINETALSYRASLKSTVLLKNDGILPFRQTVRIGVIGQAATQSADARIPSTVSIIARLADSRLLSFVGACDGYDLSREISDELIEPACNLASQCDAILLFLKPNPNSISSKLPANQIALLDAVSSIGRPIIAVLCNGDKVDSSFDKNCRAVLLSGMDGSHSAEALLDIIVGRNAPSGKLANSIYENTDEWFHQIESDKKKGKNKIGSFFGYRYYDAVNENVKYPFGLGLSYNEFVLENVTTDQKGLGFSILNKGNTPAETVVEIYIGKGDSKIVRPKKELKAFVRVALLPNERKEVQVNFYKNDLSVYDEKNGAMVIEKGLYDVMIGFSLNDIRLSTQINISGETLSSTGEKIDEFVKDNSNIVKEDYRLRSGVKSIFSNTFKILAIALLVFAILGDTALIAIGVGGTDLAPYWLFVIFSLIIVNGPLAGIIAFAIKLHLVNKRRVKQALALSSNKSDHWSIAELEKEIPYAKMFIRELNSSDDDDEEDDEETDFSIKKEVKEKTTKDDFWRYVDDTAKLDEIARNFVSYASTKGLYITPLSVKKIISAVCSSRLIILKNEPRDVLTDIAALISNYFGSQYYNDLANQYEVTSDLLYSRNSSYGSDVRTQLFTAIDEADRKPHSMVFSTLVDVQSDRINTYFSQAIRFLANPMRKNTFVVKNDGGTSETVEIPSNMWFIMCLNEETENSTIPHFVSELATIINLDVRRTEKQDSSEDFRYPTFETMVYLSDKAKTHAEIDEIQWKKIDRLENYVASRIDYSIGNKASIQMEKFAAIFVTIGGEAAEAIDCSVASKLLPEIVCLLKDKPAEDGSDLTDTIESYFGEENVSECRKVIKKYKSSGTL